jgi:hypothetical protein
VLVEETSVGRGDRDVAKAAEADLEREQAADMSKRHHNLPCEHHEVIHLLL